MAAKAEAEAEGTKGAGGDAGEPDVKELDSAVEANPHCAQLRAALARPFLKQALQVQGFSDSHRFLSLGWPRMKYCKRPDEERSSCHWGQLKLFESEMKCLTDYFREAQPGGGWFQSAPSRPPTGSGRADAPEAAPLVVYVGAAPGRHVPSLSRRFPSCRFELYDPAKFDDDLRRFAESEEARGRVALFEDFFNEEKAEELAARCGQTPIIFISDVRTADEKQMGYEEVERCIVRDMERQRQWVKTLRPAVSLLKFRLPWGPGLTRYLHGRILVQAFPPCTSTETRLVVPREALDAQDATYDQEEYEERLMYHNTVGRAQLYDLRLPAEGAGAIPGLDQCYDCAALVATVRGYLAARRGAGAPEPAGEEVAAEVAALLDEVSSGRTLATQYHVSSSRHGGRQFAKRRYTDADGQDSFAVQGGLCLPRKRRRRGAQQAEE